MKGLGIFLVLAAIASAILPMLERQLVIFMWIDNWGATVGWIIRGAILVLGIVLFCLGAKGEKSEA